MSLKVSEMFYSVQGEGVSTGVPSIFIRLSGCNLMCGGPGGILKKEGNATWWCDTEAVWKLGKHWSYQAVLNKIVELGQLDNVKSHRTHLIWTGGEPTIPVNINGIIECIDFLHSQGITPFNEIETNGTIVVPDRLYGSSTNLIDYPLIDQINCSPKLSNSGMSASMRINAAAIEQILDHQSGEGYFKFVISDEEDIQEIERDFITPFDIPFSAVVLMPGLDCRADAFERSNFVYEMGKKYGYRAVTRGHVIAWDRLTGV